MIAVFATANTLSIPVLIGKLIHMKRIFFILLLALSILAEELPPAPQILATARAQLPPYPVTMKGTLKEHAANGFVKKTLDVEMTLDWRAEPPHAKYKITDKKSGNIETLELLWPPGSPVFRYLMNNSPVDNFDPHSEIQNTGITWSDLSFTFLWNPEAQTLRTDKKMGKKCYLISIPRPKNNRLLLWIEKETGRMMGAEEQDVHENRQKILKVVSVKKFGVLWMVKDLDIIRPETGAKASLRIHEVKEAE